MQNLSEIAPQMGQGGDSQRQHTFLIHREVASMFRNEQFVMWDYAVPHYCVP